MARPKNKKVDVFKYIDMSGGADACWPWTASLSGSGRPYIEFEGRKYLAYRLTYELVNGAAIADNVMARHTCDNEICCNPNHIIPGTHQENMNDMKQRERHGLPHTAVRAIKKLLADGFEHKVIAERFGISRTMVTSINLGRSYSHVELTQEEHDE